MSNSNGEEDLERLFGDPFDDHNPVGFRAVLAADSARRLPAAGERLLDEWNCNAEFVPVALGGRWRDVDELGRRLRPVFRRDAALGLGYGVTSLMAAVNVWTAGSAAQQDWLSGELLQRRRTAVAFHELAHGNDLLRNDCTARITDGQVIFRGRKEVINNVERAESVLLLARTGEDTGGRSQSLFLIDKKELSPHPGYLPRWATTGMRACELGGIDVTGCQAPAATLVGLPGTAAETAMRAFQITRVALPSMALGILDTALHLAYRFAVARQVYGQSVSDLPVVRATLAAAFVDLLTADCLATAAARALQLDPRPGAGLAAAVKYLVPQLLDEAMRALSLVFGSTFYINEGPYAVFEKFYRDLPLVSVGHAGPTACLLTIIAELPVLAKRAWRADPAPAALFDLAADLPALDLTRLALLGGRRDLLASSLLADIATADARTPARVLELMTDMGDQLSMLGRQCLAAAPVERGPAASAAGFQAGERYAVLLAAAACIGFWRHGIPLITDQTGDDTAWIQAALLRLQARLGGGDGALPELLAETLFGQLERRVLQRRSGGLRPTAIFR